MHRVLPVRTKRNEKEREHPLTRIWPNARMSWRAKSAREHVVKHVMEVLLGRKNSIWTMQSKQKRSSHMALR